MTLKTWFLGAATVKRAAAARQADVPIDDFDTAADDLGFGPRLSFSQIEETIAALGDPDDDEEDVEDDEDDGDDDAEDEDDQEDDGDE